MGLDASHIVGHDGANTRTGGEEKVCDIYFVSNPILSNGLTILIGQPEVCNPMEFFDVLERTINQFKINHGRLVNR